MEIWGSVCDTTSFALACSRSRPAHSWSLWVVSTLQLTRFCRGKRVGSARHQMKPIDSPAIQSPAFLPRPDRLIHWHNSTTVIRSYPALKGSRNRGSGDTHEGCLPAGLCWKFHLAVCCENDRRGSVAGLLFGSALSRGRLLGTDIFRYNIFT